MHQVLLRRLTHYVQQDAGFSEHPDVLLIDGGVEHTKVAEDVLQTLGLDIPAYGMVKDDKHRTRALVTAAGDEIAISAVPSVSPSSVRSRRRRTASPSRTSVRCAPAA